MESLQEQLHEAHSLLTRVRQACLRCPQDPDRESLALDIEAYCLEHNLCGPDGEEHTP